MKNEKLVMIIYACMRIINVFLGPFLAAYFITVSLENVTTLSLFNILNYVFLCIFGMIAGYITERKGTLSTFRLGIFIRFLCVFLIMILGEKITTYYSLVSFTYGFSSMFFYLPFNLYHADCVQNSERASFEFKMNVIKYLISVFVPFLLGSLISVTNYQLAALVILIFSVIQILASFYLKKLPKSDRVYDLLGFLKKILKNKQGKKLLFIEYLNGLLFSEGVLGTVITILIMLSFKSEFHLGVINSLAALFSLCVIYFYTKKYKGKDDKNIIYISGIIIFISMLFLLINVSGATIFFYNVIFSVFGTGILAFAYGLRLFNEAKKRTLNKEKVEYWSLREVVLNLGRITGYLLLLIVGMIGLDYLNYLLIFLSFIVLIFIYFLAEIDKNEF